MMDINYEMNFQFQLWLNLAKVFQNIFTADVVLVLLICPILLIALLLQTKFFSTLLAWLSENRYTTGVCLMSQIF